MTNEDLIEILNMSPVDMAAHMTKREHITVEVLKAMLSNSNLDYHQDCDRLCKDARYLADTLIKELKNE